MSSFEQNAAFLPGLKYFSRLLCRLLEAQSANYKYKIEWGPTIVHGLDTIVAPPTGAVDAFNKLVSYIRWWNPGVPVRVTAASNIVMESDKTFPLYLTQAAYPATTPPDPVPDPYLPPVYCWPCEGKVMTA